MKNEKYRTQKMIEGYDEHSIQELDEIAAIPAQDGRMSSSDRLVNFGRTVERLEQRGGTNTTRGEYELYPNQVANKGKGKSKNQGSRPSSWNWSNSGSSWTWGSAAAASTWWQADSADPEKADYSVG